MCPQTLVQHSACLTQVSRDGFPVRRSADRGRQGGRGDGSRRGLRRSLTLSLVIRGVASLSLVITAWLLLLLSNFQSERRSSKLHVVTLGDGEESSSATAGVAGGGAVGPVVLLVSLVLRGRGAVRHDLVEVGQVLRRGVDVPDALVVTGPPRVRDVHGTAAVGVERYGPEASAEAAGQRGDDESSNGPRASIQMTLRLYSCIKCTLLYMYVHVYVEL